MPQSILNFVVHTRTSLFLDVATTHPVFGRDPYIMEHNVQSILCVPLLHRHRLAGVLYLENRPGTATFTRESLATFRIIAKQAAVNIHNARLSSQLRIELNFGTESCTTNVRALPSHNGGECSKRRKIVVSGLYES